MAVVGTAGDEVSSRVCRDEAEAEAYASTLRQHIEWLSEPKFREYYRLPEEPASSARPGSPGGA